MVTVTVKLNYEHFSQQCKACTLLLQVSMPFIGKREMGIGLGQELGFG